MDFIIVPLLIAFLFGIAMGGSGIAPSFSTVFGAEFLNQKYIPWLFGIFVFLGALFSGQNTSQTIGQEIVSSIYLNTLVISIILFSIFISILIADIIGIPQSTSQSTVFSLVAASIYFQDFKESFILFEIVPTWFIAPLISFIITFLLGKFIYKPLRKTGITISKKVNNHIFTRGFLLLMALYVSYSIGANNVANAAGPVNSIINEKLNLNGLSSFTMLLSILIIAPGFGIGASLFSKKILKNTGKEIYIFGRFEALIIAFVSGTILLLISIFKGIPTSLVQLNVAAILGIGVAKLGIKNIFKKTQVNKFFLMWIISPIISFSLTILLLVIFN